MARQEQTTDLLEALVAGDASAMEQLMPMVYDELHQLAQRHLVHERNNHTLNATALVHEAYIKLVKLDRMQWQNRAHFLAIAARIMRQILINYALKRNAIKRGGGAPNVTLNESLVMSKQRAEMVLALDEALDRLKALSERQHQVVEYRIFGGMTVEETAEVMGISPATVKRDWTGARAWLNRELGEEV
ncbi:MAG TPA: sigma-70 family RNA polymerase sigma factor [Rhodothermales bacterium]|nr:sigma-70 family RNA polymerase sigma factor [Rhodothermales bacterium]